MQTMKTICAISTPAGVGGIAVIRVSGEDAIAVSDSLFVGRRRLVDQPANSVVYGKMADIDDVLVSIFRAPHSFTGEDVVEISCHGSIYIQQTLLQMLIDAGARMAEAGEFTRRAFLNGKMDLTQAEAVADLIASQSKAAHDIAFHQMRGGISDDLHILRDKLLHFTSLLELELDFADHEDLEFVDRSELQALCLEIKTHISQLVASFKVGNAIKNGIPVAIVGPTNAGKSTLLNALVGENRAIVSAIHGTTRDTIEDTIIIDGILYRFIDTAGLRQTTDQIETIGIERSRQAAEKAQIIIYVQDATNIVEQEYTGDNVITVYNKADLTPHDGLSICAKNGDISALKNALKAKSCLQPTGNVLISNARHYEALQVAFEAIKRLETGMNAGFTGEILALDLHDCLDALGEITGEVSSQDVLNNIFSKFCIGK